MYTFTSIERGCPRHLYKPAAKRFICCAQTGDATQLDQLLRAAHWTLIPSTISQNLCSPAGSKRSWAQRVAGAVSFSFSGWLGMEIGTINAFSSLVSRAQKHDLVPIALTTCRVSGGQVPTNKSRGWQGAWVGHWPATSPMSVLISAAAACRFEGTLRWLAGFNSGFMTGLSTRRTQKMTMGSATLLGPGKYWGATIKSLSGGRGCVKCILSCIR